MNEFIERFGSRIKHGENTYNFEFEKDNRKFYFSLYLLDDNDDSNNVAEIHFHKQSLEIEDQSKAETPFGKVLSVATPEYNKRKHILFVLGSSNNKILPITNYEDLANVISILHYFVYREYETQEEILKSLFGDLFDTQIPCKKCGKVHNENGEYCAECRAELRICSVCGKVIENDDYIEKKGSFMCYHCAEETGKLNRSWKDYSSKPEPIFIKDKDEDTDRFYGFELEVEQSRGDFSISSTSSMIASFVDNVYFKNDGSLDDGFEIIHQPATIQYYQNNIKGLLAIVKKLGFETGETTGLHIHVGKNVFGKSINERIHNVGRLMYLVGKNFDEYLLPLSNRLNTSYCENIDISDCNISSTTRANIGTNTSTNNSSIFTNIVDDFAAEGSRYKALNILFKPTVEFRLPQGTLDFDEFMAHFYLYDTMITLACSNVNLDLPFLDLVKGHYEQLDKYIDEVIG